jgi:hypothetical protein
MRSKTKISVVGIGYRRVLKRIAGSAYWKDDVKRSTYTRKIRRISSAIVSKAIGRGIVSWWSIPRRNEVKVIGSVPHSRVSGIGTWSIRIELRWTKIKDWDSKLRRNGCLNLRQTVLSLLGKLLTKSEGIGE